MSVENRHIEAITNTRSNLQTNLDNAQIAIETDNNENLVYKDDDGTYHVVTNLGDDVNFGNILLTGYIGYSSSNKILITDSIIDLVSNGFELLTFQFQSDPFISINNNQSDIDTMIWGTSVDTPVVTVLADGTVGINNIDPEEALHIKGEYPIVKIEDTAGDAEGSGLKLVTGTINAIIKHKASKGLVIDLASTTEALVISHAGNVGIGQNTPTRKLDVNGSIRCSDLYFNSGYFDTKNLQDELYYARTTANSAQEDANSGISIGSGAASRAEAGLTRGMTTHATDAIITPIAKQLTDATAVSLFEVALPSSGETCAGMFSYRIHSWNGADFQVIAGICNYVAGNKAGTITTAIGHTAVGSGLETELKSSGTLTDTFTAVAGTGKVTIKISADTSLTPSANQFYIVYTLHNDSDQAITILWD